MLLTKLLPVIRGAYRSYQRVPNEFRGNTHAAEELLLKGKNAQRLLESTPDQLCPPRPPGPELRADVIDIAISPVLQLPGQPQVKPRKIRQNRQRRLALFRLRHELVHCLQ